MEMHGQKFRFKSIKTFIKEAIYPQSRGGGGKLKWKLGLIAIFLFISSCLPTGGGGLPPEPPVEESIIKEIYIIPYHGTLVRVQSPMPLSWSYKIVIDLRPEIDCGYIRSNVDSIFSFNKHTDIVSTTPGISLLMKDDSSGFTCRIIMSGSNIIGRIEMAFDPGKAWDNKNSLFDLLIDESKLRNLLPGIAPVTTFRFKIIDVTSFTWADGKYPWVKGVEPIFPPDPFLNPGSPADEGLNVPINSQEKLNDFISMSYDPLHALMPSHARIILKFSQPLVSFGYEVSVPGEYDTFDWKSREAVYADSNELYPLYFYSLESRKGGVGGLIPSEIYWLRIHRKPPEFVGDIDFAQGISGESINYFLGADLVSSPPDEETVNIPFRASPINIGMDRFYNRSALGDHSQITIKNIGMIFRWEVEGASGAHEATFFPTTSLKYSLSNCKLYNSENCYNNCEPITNAVFENYDRSGCFNDDFKGRNVIRCPQKDMNFQIKSDIGDIDKDVTCEFEIRGGVSGEVHGQTFSTPDEDYLLETYPVNLKMKRPVIKSDGGIEAEDVVWSDNVIERICVWVDEEITEMRLRDGDGRTVTISGYKLHLEDTRDGWFLYCAENIVLPDDFQLGQFKEDNVIYEYVASLTVIDNDENESLPADEIKFRCTKPPRKYIDEGWYVSMDSDEKGNPFVVYVGQNDRVNYSYYDPGMLRDSGQWITVNLFDDAINSLLQSGDYETASSLATLWANHPKYIASSDSGPDVVIDADGLPQVCVVASWDENASPVQTNGEGRFSANSYLFYLKATGIRWMQGFYVYDWKVKIISSLDSADKNPYMEMPPGQARPPSNKNIVRPFGCAISVNKKVSNSPVWIAFTGDGAPGSTYLTSPWYARIDWIPGADGPAPGMGSFHTEIGWLPNPDVNRALGTQIDVAVNPTDADTEVHAHFVSVGDVGDSFRNDLLYHQKTEEEETYFANIDIASGRKLFYCEIPQSDAYEDRQCIHSSFIGDVPPPSGWRVIRTYWSRPSIAVLYNNPYIVATGINLGRRWLMNTITFKSYLFLLTKGTSVVWNPSVIDFIDEAPTFPQAGTIGIPAKIAIDEKKCK